MQGEWHLMEETEVVWHWVSEDPCIYVKHKGVVYTVSKEGVKPTPYKDLPLIIFEGEDSEAKTIERPNRGKTTGSGG